MQKYRSHKVVEAAQIVAAEFREDGSGVVIFRDDDGGSTHIEVPAGFKRPNTDPSMNPDGGDYLVRYEDGYLSWSPKAAFEAGYTSEPATWQERALKEATELDEKIGKLRKYLLSGPMLDEQALALLQRQFKTMTVFSDILNDRLRHAGVIGTETPPVVREAD